jgi:hypothetical protein
MINMSNRLKEIESQGRLHLAERADVIPESRLMPKVPRRRAGDNGTCAQLIGTDQAHQVLAGAPAHHQLGRRHPDSDAAEGSRFEHYRRRAMQRGPGILGQRV